MRKTPSIRKNKSCLNDQTIQEYITKNFATNVSKIAIDSFKEFSE